MIGAKLDKVIVIGVREDSPAALAGVEVGDIITNMNGADTKAVEFSSIISTLRYKTNKNVNIKVMRNDTIRKISFQLKRMI
jgi:C-terminal processing protease CtpA/Prc